LVDLNLHDGYSRCFNCGHSLDYLEHNEEFEDNVNSKYKNITKS